MAHRPKWTTLEADLNEKVGADAVEHCGLFNFAQRPWFGVEGL